MSHGNFNSGGGCPIKRFRGGRWWGWRPTKPYIRLESSQQSLISNNIKGNFKPVSVQYVCKNFIGEGGKSPTSSISKMVQKSSE